MNKDIDPDISSDRPFLVTADDGICRCWWGARHPDYRHYHDHEWGHPTSDDHRLFEKICLEGFQSGLSWLTILRKRENFREAFDGFDFTRIAAYDDGPVVDRLLGNAGIVRHRGKIKATLHNARRALELVEAYGSLAAYLWQWEPPGREPDLGSAPAHSPLPSSTRTSRALSADLKARGWMFVGPTTAYALMQATGMVNDHLEGCASFAPVEALRAGFVRPAPGRLLRNRFWSGPTNRATADQCGGSSRPSMQRQASRRVPAVPRLPGKVSRGRAGKSG